MSKSEEIIKDWHDAKEIYWKHFPNFGPDFTMVEIVSDLIEYVEELKEQIEEWKL